MLNTKWIFILVSAALLTACEKIAILSTPAKQSSHSLSQLSIQAEKNFWYTLHTGNYSQIPHSEKLLTAAYLENPNDPRLAAHLGFLHIWKITERQREKSIANNPLIVNEIILAKKYFADAVQLAPHDARYQGFLADSTLIQGQIFNDSREQVKGYYQLKAAINQWPEFNYFTGGYPMSTFDAHSQRFQEGLSWQWKTMEVCAGKSINKTTPTFKPYLFRETQTGSLRACWNSWIAPHNFEGFFLNMGDMLVKKGDWQTGIKIYENAKLSKTYHNWPYRYLLENRIKNARKNVSEFKRPSTAESPNTNILFNSGFGCVACHQTTKTR